MRRVAPSPARGAAARAAARRGELRLEETELLHRRGAALIEAPVDPVVRAPQPQHGGVRAVHALLRVGSERARWGVLGGANFALPWRLMLITSKRKNTSAPNFQCLLLYSFNSFSEKMNEIGPAVYEKTTFLERHP